MNGAGGNWRQINYFAMTDLSLDFCGATCRFKRTVAFCFATATRKNHINRTLRDVQLWMRRARAATGLIGFYYVDLLIGLMSYNLVAM